MKKYFKKILFVVVLSVFSLPLVLNAQDPELPVFRSGVEACVSCGDSAFSDLREFILEIVKVIMTIIPILFALAFVIFFWGVTKYVINADNAAERKAGRSYMIWGIIALFILFSFMGIIRFFVGEFGEFGFTNSIIDGVLLDSKK